MSFMDRPAAVPSGSAPEGTVPSTNGAADLPALLRRCSRGDESAFAALYDATASRLYGLVVRVIRDPAQSEEVTQEVFLEIWRTSARYDAERGSALSWLMTIAHRKAVDRVRSAEASSRRDTTFHQRDAKVEHDETAEAVTSTLEAQRVRQAVSTLTPAQREAIELAYFGGYTHVEVATMLDLPVGTAKTRIRDGLIRLRDTMGVSA